MRLVAFHVQHVWSPSLCPMLTSLCRLCPTPHSLYTHTHVHSVTHTHTHTHKHALTHTHTHTLSLAHILTVTLTHSHTHTLTHSHAHTYTHVRFLRHVILCVITSIACSVVQQLGLPDCGINPSGARYISEVLCNHHITCNIQKLNLSDNVNVSEPR